MRLTGERALVTGSSAGIGAAIARRFAAEGAHVVITGRDRTRADFVQAAIKSAGGHAEVVLADLTEPDAARRLVKDAVTSLGGLTILVNNAVATVVDESDAVVGDLTDAAWDATVHLNLTIPMQLSRAAIPHLRRAGHGSIINISSRQAERASRGLAAYVASKAGLNGLTRAIAVDHAGDGIRCNTISPGYVLNERRDADLTDDRRAQLEAMHLTRLGMADDVAHAAVYLASRESDFLTGSNLPLDGGGSAARGAVLG
jgi:NAD(P)-dependent dehydrogenase (short-subunit alcohol dehydrogenase family)